MSLALPAIFWKPQEIRMTVWSLEETIAFRHLSMTSMKLSASNASGPSDLVILRYSSCRIPERHKVMIRPTSMEHYLSSEMPEPEIGQLD